MGLTFIGRNVMTMYRDGPRFVPWKRRRVYTRLENDRAWNTGVFARNLRRHGIKMRVSAMLRSTRQEGAE